MEFRALQPQREISPIAQFVVGAMESCDIKIVARIYADTLAEPVEQELSLRLNVNHVALKVVDLIAEAGKSEEKH